MRGVSPGFKLCLVELEISPAAKLKTALCAVRGQRGIGFTSSTVDPEVIFRIAHYSNDPPSYFYRFCGALLTQHSRRRCHFRAVRIPTYPM